MKLDFLLTIAKVMPIILFISGALAYFGLMHMGPREMPKTTQLNKKLGLCIIIVGLGLVLAVFHNQKFYNIAGWAGSAIGLLLYGWVYTQARKEFPAMTDKDWIIMKKSEQNARIEAIAARREAKKQNKQN